MIYDEARYAELRRAQNYWLALSDTEQCRLDYYIDNGMGTEAGRAILARRAFAELSAHFRNIADEMEAMP